MRSGREISKDQLRKRLPGLHIDEAADICDGTGWTMQVAVSDGVKIQELDGQDWRRVQVEADNNYVTKVLHFGDSA